MASPIRRHMAIVSLLATSAGLPFDRLCAKVGISAQIPSGAHAQENLNYHTFWKFLLDKRDASEKIPQERLDQIS
jgi:hypothetical protein